MTISAPFDLKEHLEPRISGKVRWEHAEEVDLLNVVNNITMGGYWPTYGGWFHKPDGSLKWARYFLTTSQGGAYTGQAVVFVYGSGGYWNRDSREWTGMKPSAYRVAICKHEKEGSGTPHQERRGWHPGRCAKCGLDLSIDSGD
jgi:hypothetical protein